MLKIKNTVTGDELQVADNDFSEGMNWEQAKKRCSELGSGWRLPTKEELKAMYDQLYMKGKGNFENDLYWSSTETTNSYAMGQDFMNGIQQNFLTRFPFLVRAVRDL